MKGLIKFLFAATIGAVYGLLFAQKPGKKLRADLKKSENPLRTLFEEGVRVDKEARGFVVDWAENSKELQAVLSTGRAQFDDFVEGTKELSLEGTELAKEKLEELSINAKKAAEKLKKTIVEKSTIVGKDVIKKTEKLKDEAKEKINKIGKEAAKTIKHIRKN